MIICQPSISTAVPYMTSVSGRALVSALLGCDAHFPKQFRSIKTIYRQGSGTVKLSRTSFRDFGRQGTSGVLLPLSNDTQRFGRWGSSVRALDEKAEQVAENKDVEQTSTSNASAVEGNGATFIEEYPSGDLEYQERGGWDGFVAKCRMLIAWPWQRVKKGSILKLKFAGSVTEQVPGRFSQGLSLPMICQNLIKAAHDPRIAGIVIRFEPLDCGWGKIDEICRHIDYFKKSGKFLVGFVVVAGEKEYYLACKCGEIYAPPGAYISLLGLKVQATFLGGVLEKAGVEPQVQAIGKYKSLGDQLTRKNMSEPNREVLTALLDDIYDNWLDGVSTSRGKTKQEVEELLNAGIFELPKLKEGGWVTDLKYEDEVEEMLKQRLGIKEEKTLPSVDYKRYSKVKEWTLGLSGGRTKIAVLRAVGGISRARGGGLGISGEGIVSDTFIEKIRRVRDAKEFKAVVLRIDSPGGDALASDLMWREIKLLAAKKPVIASMADVAASGGYYMAMAAGVIVAESLTLTGSIGVVTGKFNLGQLYERIGYTKEIISRGRFAELDAEQRSFSPEEQEYFARSAQNSYKSFRDKAALSRSMEIEKMEEVAQGRVWTGKAAATRGLVDAVGGFWRAVAIAKVKAGIALNEKVSLVEMSQRQTSVFQVLRGGASVFLTLMELAGTENGRILVNFLVKEAALPMNFTSTGIQARMQDISTAGPGRGAA
ncbi:unnamed protein product [Calypogeia fissa]